MSRSDADPLAQVAAPQGWLLPAGQAIVLSARQSVAVRSVQTLGRMNIHHASSDISLECERILRTLPRWFGIEEALLEYARDSERFPTFFASAEGTPVAFLTVREHFPRSWEVHCIAVQASARGMGIGKELHAHVEAWLHMKGVEFLQVKTLADTHASAEYAESRSFYARLGYKPLEVFPTLWGPRLPVLQLVKVLSHAAHMP